MKRLPQQPIRTGRISNNEQGTLIFEVLSHTNVYLTVDDWLTLSQATCLILSRSLVISQKSNCHRQLKEYNLNQQLYISTSCSIINHTIYVDGQAILTEDTSLTFPQFAKKVYKEHLSKYPKFFKMDSLSKLAFLAAEFLFKASDILNLEQENNIAIVLSNRASSLETDRKHQAAIEDADAYFPSPAVFVYTLPNIGIGEISIRHKLYSENAFFVFDSFNSDFLQKYASALIHNQKANSVLCGWVDYDETDYQAFLYLVSTEGTIAHTTQNIQSIFKK